MTNKQIKTIALASLKATAAIVLFTGKAFLYLCLALYVCGELLFSEYQAVPTPRPVRTVAKTIAQPTVLAIELPEETEPTDVEKETIALAADARRYAKLTSVQLRKECSTIGIKWRNAHGTKHLTKAEMLTALAA